MTASLDQQTRAGVLFAIAAYSMWGFAPMYFKLLDFMPATEILVHRVVWSAILLLILVVLRNQWPKIKAAITSRNVMLILLAAGLLLAANWLLFIWAVNNDQLLEASLGYYINPLFNILFGRLFLAERLRPMQKAAVVLAITGVAIAIAGLGYLPWIALVLAISFSLYGLLRKKVAVDSMPGLFIETSMMLPAAVVYWLVFGGEGSNMLTNDTYSNTLLLLAGVITTAPLLCFTAAARRIQYSTLGFFQYIGPSIMFLLAVFYYQEPLDVARLITFGFVWTGLVIFCLDSLRNYRQQQRAAKVG
ncbi:EamA family transporter RarD [Alteromonas sp. ASW11-36]|uniref:EamA family transporter RarD n=1 Tax=Alteromonas arenosi TaxID=3055817 RepID=A0ABT7SSP4_9ALTE|nr:EamA family transporter RarD [Alteromonas sp. ASW11-36]MDM7859175.1 EamA family transporter RarD [Alteromonas sp. ASW11-36]